MSMSHQAESSVATAASVPAREFAVAFEQVEAELQNLSERELLPVNIDVPSAVATVLGALPELQALRQDMLGMPRFDVARFDKLRTYALALGHTHAVYRAAVGPRDTGVADLAEQLSNTREVLYADALALAKRGLLDEGSVSKLRSGQGYKNLAFDVASLVTLFRERWPEIAGRTAVQQSELDAAAQLAQSLITAVGLREQAPAVAGAAASARQRAFTLFVNAYDDARRAVGFLRWHENDAESIAPSLYAGRGRRPTASESEPEQPTTGGDIAPAVPAASGSPSNEVAIPAGLPGSPPFARS